MTTWKSEGVFPEWIEACLPMFEGQTRESEQYRPCQFPPGLIEKLIEGIPPNTRVVRCYTVICPPGKPILRHTHPEEVRLYYVRPVSPIEIEGTEYLPEPGEIVRLQPNIWHSVPGNDSDQTRLSIALRVFLDERK